MSIRRISLAVGLGLCLTTACKKDNPTEKPQTNRPAPQQAGQQAAISGQTVARVHWIGKKRLAADPNAASVMEVWNLAESVRLENQTLDKLALAPWRSEVPELAQLATNYYPVTNYQTFVAGHPSASRLRPLLDDLLREESCIEVHQTTNHPAELVLAIRLSDARANSWQQDLARVLESLTGVAPKPAVQQPAIWRVELPAPPVAATNGSPGLAGRVSHVILARTGGWTILDVVMAGHPGASGAETGDPLLSDVASRIKNEQAPFGKTTGGSWVESTLDLPRLAGALNLNWFAQLSALFAVTNQNLPTVSLSVSGDGQNVRLRGDLEFSRPLPLELEAWNVPTNLVRDPLIGFMAVRGVRPLLSAFKPWSDLQLGTPPNQAFFWAQSGLPRFHFVAAPSAEASNQVVKLSDFVLAKINPIVSTNRMKLGSFEPLDDLPGVKWKGFALIQPTLHYDNFGENPFMVAGFSASSLTNSPTPTELVQQLDAGTNLVWYDWEFTGRCAEGLATMSQLARNVISKARLTYTTGLSWLAAASQKLGNSVTGIKLVSPTHLNFSRASTIGLTGVEMNLLIDWLESPDFPAGLHSLRAPEPPPPPQPHQ
jgi:hypothetical protein